MQKRARAALWFLLIAGLVPAAMAEEPALQPYELLWRQDLGRRIGREILIGSDWTCAASLDRQVSRYRLRDGARFWKHRPKAGVQAGLGGGTDGILGISDFPRGLLFCLDAETGAQRWTAQLGEAWTPPLMGAGRVYAASLRGSLSARDLQTGEELWHRNGPGLIRGALSLHDSLLIVPTVSDTLYALHRETGAFVWTARPYGALYGAPVACGGSHWTLSYEGVLMEWDLTTGRGMVRQRLGGRYRAGLAADGDLLIALSSGGDLQVLALPQLTVRWRQALLSATELPPVIRAGWVWVGLRDGTLRALRLSDGRPMVKIAVGEALATPVEFADSLLIVGTVGGDLRAYRSCGRPVTPGALGAIPPARISPKESWAGVQRPMFAYEQRDLPAVPALVSGPAPRSILDPLRPRLNGWGRVWAGCWVLGTVCALWLQHEADDAHDRYAGLGDPRLREEAFDDAQRYDRGALGVWFTSEFFFVLTVKNWMDRDAEDRR